MFKRTFTTLALGLTLAVAATAQEPDDLQFNKRTFRHKEAIQAQTVLRLQPAPQELSDSERQAHYRREAINQALDWLTQRGYLEQSKAGLQVGFQVYNTNEGLVLVINGRAVGYLGPGPFLPGPEPELERLDTLFNVIVLRDQRMQEPVFNY